MGGKQMKFLRRISAQGYTEVRRGIQHERLMKVRGRENVRFGFCENVIIIYKFSKNYAFLFLRKSKTAYVCQP